MESMVKRNWQFLTPFGGLLLIIALVLVACGDNSQNGQINWPNKNTDLSEYVNISPSTSSTLKPYIKGKIVVVIRTTFETPAPDTNLNMQLDGFLTSTLLTDGYGDILANNSNEVGTIIWLDYSETPAGEYTNGQVAWQITCTVTIIDKSENQIVGTNSFTVNPPETIPVGYRLGTVNVPFDEIAKYIESLPKK